MRTFKSVRDLDRAKTPEQKLWYSAGIPSRFWDDKGDRIEFKGLSYDQNVVTLDQQQEWYDKLLEAKSWRKNWLVAIGSDPTDTEAITLLVRLAKRVLAEGKYITMQDMSWNDAFETDDEDPPLVYFGYNLISEMTIQRIQRTRDWLNKYDAHLRVLAIAGNPIDVSMRVLRAQPNAVIYVDGTRRVRFSLA